MLVPGPSGALGPLPRSDPGPESQMPKPMTSLLLVPAAILFLTVAANAQLHSGMPAPMPGVPMTPPPVDHPALGAQPWFNDTPSKSSPEPEDAKEPANKAGK